MSKESGLIIGSIIFLVLGVVATIVFYVYVLLATSIPTKFKENISHAWLHFGAMTFGLHN